MGLSYTITRDTDAAILTFKGEMTEIHFAIFEECLVETSMITEKYVIIDMTGVNAIDQQGLETFQQMWLSLARTDVELRVCGLKQKIKPLFSVVLVDNEIKETLADCLESFGLRRSG
jgi:anti-anti-sigma regulatory factor